MLFKSDLLKSYLADTVVKADMELFKDAFAAKDVEADAEALGESDRGL
ncbi:MAG: hypothetical protein HZA12_05825 [Nitrospirae bacterium]|nr:hypothetical protein [Nitrospirota bacterium]